MFISKGRVSICNDAVSLVKAIVINWLDPIEIGIIKRLPKNI